MSKRVSIIIPCKEVDEYTKECVQRCLLLDYSDYEVILLPDDTTEDIVRVKVIPTGPVTPGAKRNIGIANSSGEICAFIDSDAYPRSDWLRNAVKYFDDPQVAAVGGPALTPEEDGMMQKAGGYILSSFMVGSISSRHKTGKSFESDDIHSCNLIVRKDVLEDVGGWNETYWPGEDTLLCMKISEGPRMKIIYSSDVIVYHHRRRLFMAHLRQIWGYGLHRGYFAKKFPKNSRKPIHFLPSLLVLSLSLGLFFALLIPYLRLPYAVLLSAYLAICFFEGVKTRHRAMVVVVPLGIVLTHIIYGLAFMKGILTVRLREEGIPRKPISYTKLNKGTPANIKGLKN